MKEYFKYKVIFSDGRYVLIISEVELSNFSAIVFAMGATVQETFVVSPSDLFNTFVKTSHPRFYDDEVLCERCVGKTIWMIRK